MTRWIIETSVGFTDVGLLRISECIRAYAYLILSSQAYARSSIIGNSASSLTAESAFLNNFEIVVNRKVDIQENVKRYQETLSYASSKVDYSVGENLFMLPSNMEQRIRLGTVRYTNKILVSDGKFNLGKNDEVNSSKTPAISHKDSNLLKQTADSETAITHKDVERKPTTNHEDEKIALIISLTGIFTVWYTFR